MDQQKTGQLIARRRKELCMTQKMLAEQLGVSDRAISKWERGAGFPDVSLIEHLADTLELSLAELFLGEQQSSLEEDSSAREILHLAITKLRKYKRLLILFCVLVLLLGMVIIISTAGNGWVYSHVTSAESAVSITPEILITKNDSDLIDSILSDPLLGSYYNVSPLWNDVTRYTLENDEARAFTPYFDNLGLDLQYIGIEIYGSSISITYATPNTSVYLVYNSNKISKTVILCEHNIWDTEGNLIPIGQRHGNRIDLLNENNETFYQGGYTTGWLELFRTTYY